MADLSIAIHVSMYMFIKIPTTWQPSAIDHRKRSKFVYLYVYLPHDRMRGRAHSHAGLRTRNAAADLCIPSKKMNKGGTELRSGREKEDEGLGKEGRRKQWPRYETGVQSLDSRNNASNYLLPA